jgi:hypothetical protein
LIEEIFKKSLIDLEIKLMTKHSNHLHS